MRKRSQVELRAIFGKEKQDLLTERSRTTVPNQDELSSERIRVEKEKMFAQNHPDILIIPRGNFPADVFRRKK
jgi:hypothetical protein